MSIEEKRLSYQYSLWQMIGNIVMAIVFCSIIWNRFQVRDIDWNFFDLFSIVVMIIAIVIAGSQLLYLSTAYIKQDKVVLKKFFRTEHTYTPKQIIGVKKYNLGRVHYIMVTMQNQHGIAEKYMIMNVYSWYAQSKYDAKDELVKLQGNQ
ncbi:MAG: hypothetical protein LBI72_12990 [Flavobacteriaceae bacterium]|jgi:hypothetical protein|nr:hypothetical protein [Flavobacteriaceae bacterium]